MSIKRNVKRILPESLKYYLKKQVYRLKLVSSYMYDLNRYLKYSGVYRYDNERIKLIGTIIRNYHVVEKGLTMPDTRLGFGTDRVLKLIDECKLFLVKFGDNDEQLIHAIDVIFEYEAFHKLNDFTLNYKVLDSINSLKQIITPSNTAEQKSISNEEYFSNSLSDFQKFSNSRSSLRNYSEVEIPLTLIDEALDLARNTPSACNRQTSRSYVYKDKEHFLKILELQGGNRGFGHLANKLIVITAELGVFCSPMERNQAFIDGGMFAMNTLYSLHHKRIAACILNCSTSPQKDRRLRELTGIKESEVFIAMISCGSAPENFKIAHSKRYNLSYTRKVV